MKQIYKVGDKVRMINSLDEIDPFFALFAPVTIDQTLGKVVTLQRQPIASESVFTIEEDGGNHLYASCFFAGHVPQTTQESMPRHWSHDEIDRAMRLICRLLIMPEKEEQPGVSYRFVDLITPYLERKLKHGRPRVLLLRSSLFGVQTEVFTGSADSHDEPNIYIGMAVCLCKAKEFPIPAWIIEHDRKEY